MFELEFSSAPRVHMMEGWLRTFTSGPSAAPGCRAQQVAAFADAGQWSVYVEASPADADDSMAFLSDGRRRAEHWDAAQRAIEHCQRSSADLVDAVRNGRRRVVPEALTTFFASYVQVQAYYQASSDRFTRSASNRYASVAGHGGLRAADRDDELLSGSFRERRAWRELRDRAGREGWDEESVERAIRTHAQSFASSLAGATGSQEQVVTSLRRSWADNGRTVTTTGRVTPAADDGRDAIYTALLQLGRQRLVIREGFTIAARTSASTLRQIAFSGFGDALPADTKELLWKSLVMEELVLAARGEEIDHVRVTARHDQGVLWVVDELRELEATAADELRLLVERNREERLNGPLRGLVGFRGEQATAEGRAFVLPPGRSPEENVLLCEQGLQDGDILVTGMTHPWLVPACTRSGGVVTDQGGVTCHAVVVAIEFGIPCIVGTGTATQQFRTGDQIVLDLVTGAVRKKEST